MKKVFYFVYMYNPTDEDLETSGQVMAPVVQVKLQLREENPVGQLNFLFFELPLLYGEEEQGQFWC